jgi:hypothetical protein
MPDQRAQGTLLLAAGALAAVLFAAGVSRRSYAAVAVPVGVLVAAASLVLVWLGWLLASGGALMEDAARAEGS